MILQFITRSFYAIENSGIKSDTLKVLKLTHVPSGRQILIEKGEFVRIGFGLNTFSGTVDSVRHNVIFMEGKQLPVSGVYFIKVNNERKKLLKTMRVFAVIHAIASFIIFLVYILREVLGYYLYNTFGNILYYSRDLLLFNEIFFLPVSIFIFLKGKLYQHNVGKRWLLEAVE
jgi:hypothetical protein